ncbi:uncharacterized protein DUF2017 [Brevibacterium pityocampae]
MKITPGPRGTARLDLSSAEKSVFASVFSDTAALLGHDEGQDAGELNEAEQLARLVGMGGEVERPTDPALLRLLPDVDPADPERSAEFRRLTDLDLRESKLANLRIALHSLGASGRVELDGPAQRAWLTALTDVRLVVASRLGLETDADLEDLYAREEELPDSEAMLVTVYDFLTWAQERLAGILLDSLTPPEKEDP